MTFPEVQDMSVRELVTELAILQDQITQIAARAGYSVAPPLPPSAPAPNPTPDQPFDLPLVDNDDQPRAGGAAGADGVIGMVEAVDLLEALERREQAVLAELHRRPTPAPPAHP